MAEEMMKTTFQVDINNDDGIIEVDKEAFKANLPEELEEKHFELVDSYRDQFVASVADEVLKVSEDHFEKSDNELSVMDTSIGGNATLSMSMNKANHLTVAVNISAGEVLNSVLEKADSLYKTSMSD